MPLTLRIQSYRKQAPAVAVERVFDHLGGSIGRGAGNDLELPDPGKYISRNHSKIDFSGGRYTLMDLGSNPSWVNDTPVGTGKVAELTDGDLLLIGDYALEVRIDEIPVVSVPVFQPETSPGLPFQAQPAVAPSPYAGASFDELQDSLASAAILNTGNATPYGSGSALGPAGSDPLGLNLMGQGGAGLLGAPSDPTAFRGSEPDHVAPQFIPIPASRLISPPPIPAPALGPGAMLIPDDYDLLPDILPSRHAPPAMAQPAYPSAPPATYPNHYAQPLAAAFASAAPAASAHHVNHAQQLAASLSSAAPAAQAAGDGEMLQALLRGLGLPEVKPSRSPVETAELVGAMLREAVAGTMAVLLARSMTKRESRLDMTVLGSQANNPLKFFPDAERALSQMLTNAMPGYMPPMKSIGSAFDDLKAHELAVIAGMRAALFGVLQRFDPALIEMKMEGGVMDKMLGASRKAKMWDKMVELYEDIQREADDDFQHLFGDKFSAAYEEQIGRLHGGL